MFAPCDSSESGVRYLLGLLEPSEASAAMEAYETSPSRRLFVIRNGDGQAIACIGVELVKPGEGLVRHLAVALEHRGRGHGRALVEGAIAALGLVRLEADVEWPAASFFRALGFRAWSLTVTSYSTEGESEEEGGTQVPAELYRCVWVRS